MIVIIPSFEPDQRLVDLVAELRRSVPDWQIVVIDDGSGVAYSHLFLAAARSGAVVLTHPKNQGKGVALKTGFSWVAQNAVGQSVVCADSDGQHLVKDVLRVADAVQPGVLVLGGRRFTGQVPLRSRFGNSVTRHVFHALSRIAVFDTQTGLRAYPHDLLGWLLSVPGDRFEFEFQALLRARQSGVRIVEIEIETVYELRQKSSHFRTFSDSWRIYAPLVRHGWLTR